MSYYILTVKTCYHVSIYSRCMIPGLGFFAFEKQVSSAAFGKDANNLVYVYMRAAPMGWLGAVDIMQAMARRLIFKDCGVPPSTELRKGGNFPEGDVSIVCMGGFDFIRRVK